MLAQAFTPNGDKLDPRFCKNSCEPTQERMVVDILTNATAVWLELYLQNDLSFIGVIASRYCASASLWSTPVQLTNFYSPPDGVKLSLSGAPNGRAQVAYTYNYNYYGYTGPTISGMQYVPGSGWQNNYGVGDDYSNASHVTNGSGRNGDIFITYMSKSFNRDGMTLPQ